MQDGAHLVQGGSEIEISQVPGSFVAVQENHEPVQKDQVRGHVFPDFWFDDFQYGMRCLFAVVRSDLCRHHCADRCLCQDAFFRYDGMTGRVFGNFLEEGGANPGIGHGLNVVFKIDEVPFEGRFQPRTSTDDLPQFLERRHVFDQRKETFSERGVLREEQLIDNLRGQSREGH